MNLKSLLFVFVAGMSVGFLAGLKSCASGTVAPASIVVRDTFGIPAIHDTLRATKFTTRILDGVEIHDTVVLRKIDTLLRDGGIESLTACADTIANGDSIGVCFEYVRRQFDIHVGFAPRVHDTTIMVPPTTGSGEKGLFAWHPFAGIEWSATQQGTSAIGGVAASLWKLEAAALLKVGAVVEPRVSLTARF